MISDVGDALDAIIDLTRDKEQAMTNATTQSDIDAETLRTMGANIRTQYNAGTADPMFVVFQKKMVAGLESGYEDFWLWVSDDDGDYEEADAETAVVLKRLHGYGFKTDGYKTCAKYMKSGDSFAWSFAGRMRPNIEHEHYLRSVRFVPENKGKRGCADDCSQCLMFALDWRESLVKTIESAMMAN